MDFKNETLKINVESMSAQKVKDTLKQIYDALKVKGYNPINQIVAYLMSGDPTYITSYNNARVLISKLERDEILEELVKNYLLSL
ncbi:MAG: IreB family regulatory phosphoprotein [Ruminococcaceae bacterium]|nr:IreB family regulatory phosphoprotein [Oscillospiraceae bacterium]